MNLDEDFLNQLIELRKRLLYILIGFLIITICLFPFRNNIYGLITKPLFEYLPKDSKLIATDIIDPFIIPLKALLLSSFFISLPNTIYQLWKFIAPGLYTKEKKLLILLALSSMLLFAVGVLFCYFIVLPLFLSFISHIKTSNIYIFADMGKYLNLVLTLFFIFGICFETPILILILVKLNMVSLATLRNSRAYIFVASFILSAILTPPDVLSQVMLAIPLYLLYEAGILIANKFKN